MLPTDTTFFNSGIPIWHKNSITDILRQISTFKNTNSEQAKERCFVEFEIEVEQAIRWFLEEIKSLKLIIKCRTKADDNQHFGGYECAKLAKKLRRYGEKYLHETSSENKSDSPVRNFISELTAKAKAEEMQAMNTEKELSNQYNANGYDGTMAKLQEFGYSQENLEIGDLLPSFATNL